MRSGVLALVLIGCGSVNKAPPDAAPLDAYQPDSLVCETGKMACSGACEDVMTNPLHCGGCDTVCDPSQLCSNGTCIAQYCARVKQMNPAATDGLYPNPNPGAVGDIYCDFTTGVTYMDFVVAPFTPYLNEYNLLRGVDLQNASFQKAFIAFYNKNHGIRVASTFSASNCCMTTISGMRYTFGGTTGTIPFTGRGTVSACGTSLVAGEFLTFGLNNSGFATTLPDNYFTANVPSEIAGCGDGNNAAYWYQRRQSLN